MLDLQGEDLGMSGGSSAGSRSLSNILKSLFHETKKTALLYFAEDEASENVDRNRCRASARTDQKVMYRAGLLVA